MTQPASPREVRDMLTDTRALLSDVLSEYRFMHDLAYGGRAETRRSSNGGPRTVDGAYQVSDPTGSAAIANGDYKSACRRMLTQTARAEKALRKAIEIAEAAIPEANTNGTIGPADPPDEIRMRRAYARKRARMGEA